MATSGRDSDGDDLIKRQALSLEEKVDLILDRFLGNQLRGIIGQIELIDIISRRTNELSAQLLEIRQQTLEDQRRQDAQIQQHKETADAKFSTMSGWIWGTIGFLALDTIVLIVMIMLR